MALIATLCESLRSCQSNRICGSQYWHTSPEYLVEQSEGHRQALQKYKPRENDGSRFSRIRGVFVELRRQCEGDAATGELPMAVS